MYSEQDLATVRAQQKKRWGILTIPAVLLLGTIVYSLFIRLEWLTTVSTVLLGGMMIFVYDLLIKPLRCYETHVDNALHGRTRELDCVYDAISPDLSVVDGVKYYAMTVLQTDENGDPFERLMYYDAQKPLPQIAKGTPLHIVYHDREVADWSVR